MKNYDQLRAQARKNIANRKAKQAIKESQRSDEMVKFASVDALMESLKSPE
jgi:hypothetical protein